MPLGVKKASYGQLPTSEGCADAIEGATEGDAAAAVNAAAANSRLPAIIPFFATSRHPWVAFFHLFFKAAALLTYGFGTWFSSNFVLIFVICILLLAMDFWTVKNVAGRLLVGLRWWNEIKEDGESVWVFESSKVRGE